MSSRPQGLSVIELLVALAVLGILVGVVLPGFDNFILRSNLASYTNNLISAVSLARAESVNLGGGVRIVPLDATDDANEWGPGWEVQDGAGTTLRRFDALDGAFTADATPDGIADITFTSRGLPVGGAGAIPTIDICVAGRFGNRITIFATGRTRNTDLAAGDCP